MRIKDMITQDESNWYFNKFSPIKGLINVTASFQTTPQGGGRKGLQYWAIFGAVLR